MLKSHGLLLLVLSLLVLLVVPACGGGGGEVPTTTPISTLTPVVTPAPTPTATPAGAVKVGAIIAWSGPMAMSGVLADQIIALVEEQVKNQGGILGGREVKFIKGDDAGTVAGSSGQARKLALEDKVAILTLGGESAAHFTAVSDVAEELKVPYMALATIYGIVDRKYSACMFYHETTIGGIANFLIDVVKPKTVAYLGYDAEDAHQNLDGVEGVVGARERLKAKGIDIVYEQYFPQGTADFSPYLTKIKYVKPDILVTVLNDVGQAITINKQIVELGGWGSIKYYCATESGSAKAAINMPSAVGTYTRVLWMPGSEDPGMKAFEDAFKQKYNRLPSADLSYFYNGFWTAIKAVELAGSDNPDKVAQAMRSGNLEWDSAWGHLRIGTNGTGDPRGTVVQIQEGGKLVKVWPQ